MCDGRERSSCTFITDLQKKNKSHHCFVKCRRTHLEKKEERRLCKKKCDFFSGGKSSEEAVLLVVTSARFVFPAVTIALKHLPPGYSQFFFFFISIRFCCWTTWLAGGPAPRLCFSGIPFNLASLPHSEPRRFLFGGLHVRL